MDNSTSDLDFAKDALCRVSIIAAEFGLRNKMYIAGHLAGELFLAYSVLDIADATQLPRLQRRLPKLIRDLERVCAWPFAIDSQCSILHSIVSEGTSWVKRKAEKRTEKGISKFLTDSRCVSQYLKLLRKFSSLRFKELLFDTEECLRHVNTSLYSILKEHSQCVCKVGYWPEPAEKIHHGRLRLRGDDVKTDDCVTFDLLISASPDSYDYWQDLQLIVPMNNKRKRSRYAEDPATGTSSPQRSERKRVILPGSLCEIVRAKLHSRICCHVQDSTLYQLHEGFPITQGANPGPSTSLREILKTHRLSNKMKLVLAYIIARSFWQYYDSPWMNTKWSSDTIHFLPEQNVEDNGIDNREQPVFFAYKPYFVIKFSDNSDGFMEYCDEPSIIYRYPRVLSLCIILLGIGRGQSLSVEETGQIGADLNKNWNLTQRLVGQPKSYGEFDYPSYHEIITNLLDRKPFDNCAVSKNKSKDVDVAKRKARIYEVAVAPLKDLLKGLNFADDMYKLDPINSIGHDLIPNVPVPQMAQDIYGNRGESARGRDDSINQLPDGQRGVTGNEFGSDTIIFQGDIYCTIF
ncbi:hypothetical protein GGI43DRAFT_397898 [Trichoderma evansii]